MIVVDQQFCAIIAYAITKRPPLRDLVERFPIGGSVPSGGSRFFIISIELEKALLLCY